MKEAQISSKTRVFEFYSMSSNDIVIICKMKNNIKEISIGIWIMMFLVLDGINEEGVSPLCYYYNEEIPL